MRNDVIALVLNKRAGRGDLDKESCDEIGRLEAANRELRSTCSKFKNDLKELRREVERLRVAPPPPMPALASAESIVTRSDVTLRKW